MKEKGGIEGEKEEEVVQTKITKAPSK